jgi:hypothetical protein
MKYKGSRFWVIGALLVAGVALFFGSSSAVNSTGTATGSAPASTLTKSAKPVSLMTPTVSPAPAHVITPAVNNAVNPATSNVNGTKLASFKVALDNPNKICSQCTYPNIIVMPVSDMDKGVKGSSAKKDSFFKNLGLRPVVAVSGGVNFINVNQSIYNNYSFLVPYLNFFNGSGRATQGLAGIFAGFEMPVLRGLLPKPQLAWQFGLEYFHGFSSFAVSGITGQGQGGLGNPLYNYSYRIQPTQVLLFDNKLLMTVGEIYHPYLSAGIGVARNTASNYQTSIISPGAMDPFTFANKTIYSFSYAVGAGLDVDIKYFKRLPGLRAGIGYRYINLGIASLGQGTSLNNPAAPIDGSTVQQALFAHEVLVQVSYIF